MAGKLINNKVKSLNIDVLTKLCISLDCTPNNLLNYKNDGGKLPDTMAIYRIAKPVYDISPLKYMSILKPEQLDEVLEIIKNKIPKA